MTRACYIVCMAVRKWQIQEAKTDWSALIRAAEEQGPQEITRHGAPVAVVISYALFKKFLSKQAKRKGSLLEFFSTWPELEIPARDKSDLGRVVEI
jgi:prevent-host-death family protein